MRDRLKKYRKEDQAEKRFGKDISVSTMDETPMRKTPDTIDVKGPSRLRESKPAAGGSFGSAFAAARKRAIAEGRDPDKEVFTWGGEKKVAKLATSTPKKAAPTRSPAAAAATRSAPGKAPASTAKAAAATPPPKTASASTAKAAPAKSPGLYEKDASGSWKDNSPAARRTRTGDAFTLGLTAAFRNSGSGKNDRPNAYSGMTNYYRNKEKKEAEAKAAARKDDRLARELMSSGRKPEAPSMLRASAKGGAIKKYAKGGSIDGCAVRGKTKAMRKK